MTWVVRAALALVIALTPSRARAEACGEEVALLRAHLEVEEQRAHRWNTAWAVVYGSVSAAQFGLVLAEYKPFGTYDTAWRDTLLVGGTKAALGLGVRLVLPLRVRSVAPSTSGDPCAELVALRAALADGGRRERRSFWFNHLGGLAVNLGGAILLWERHDLKTAAMSFGSGVVAGILAAYTQPRRSWHLWRERRTTWTAGASPLADGGFGVGVAGAW